jgi:hypothetical protein
MTIINCADAGIYFAGTQTGIIDLSIKNCSFSNMVQKSARIVSGVHAFNASRIRISDCYFEGNELMLSTSAAGLHLENTSVFEILGNRAVGQQGTLLAAGYVFENATEGIIKESLSYASSTVTGSANDSVYGFYMSGCKRLWLKDCQSVAGKAGSGQCTGFYSQGGVRNIFENVLAQSDQGALASSGFVLLNEANSYISDSVIREIISLNDTAYGIQLKGTCTHCHLQRNLISNNSGANGAFGIIDCVTPSESLFAKNECFNSGTHYSITYSGFSLPIISGSLSNSAMGLPALVCGTFDNISVTP